MRGPQAAALLASLIALVAQPVFAAAPETFTVRFEWVPISGTERNDVDGNGTATATLSGSKLAITGSFEGLPANVTGAKLRQGAATGARGSAVVIANLRVKGDKKGSISGDVRLNTEQREALEAGQVYIELYSEKGVPPDHATLFGWLLH